LDPQLFSTIVEHAADLVAGRINAKYSPVEVAQWLDDCVSTASRALANARTQASSSASPKFRRIEEDVLIQNGLGQFFAAKLRAGVLYEIYRKTGDAEAGKLALEQYLKARDAWAAMAQRAQKVYRSNITYGRVPIRQGHWIDRLPNIDKDVDALRSALQSRPSTPPQNAQQTIQAVMQRSRRSSLACSHTPEPRFRPGKPVEIALHVPRVHTDALPSSVLLHYRHVNQAERWRSADMEHAQSVFRSAIPAEYTNSPFPLQYYFELRRGNTDAWFYPAFNSTWSNQPYFAIYKREARNQENL
jgi:hypothetical protein